MFTREHTKRHLRLVPPPQLNTEEKSEVDERAEAAANAMAMSIIGRALERSAAEAEEQTWWRVLAMFPSGRVEHTVGIFPDLTSAYRAAAEESALGFFVAVRKVPAPDLVGA